MSVRLRTVDAPPVDIVERHVELGREDVEQIIEIFYTPLTGSFNWSYEDSGLHAAKR